MNTFLKKNKKWNWFVVIALIIAVNFFASAVHTRFDLTNEKRFTISSPVKKILHNLNDVVEVQIFLKGDLPSGFKIFSTRS
jgi:ABC-2 type transport system permease protein